jgi:acyl carrier protein
MNETQARETVLAALADVAPEIDGEGLDPQTSLRNGADLDSMDFLAYVAAVSDAIAADIPEDDYDRMDTVSGAVAYLLEIASA